MGIKTKVKAKTEEPEAKEEKTDVAVETKAKAKKTVVARETEANAKKIDVAKETETKEKTVAVSTPSWGRLSESTLRRKTVKQLTGYLADKGVEFTDESGKTLRKDSLVGLVLS